jgi:hypothetical protein
MRRTILAVLLVCLIALPGCTAADGLWSIFGAKDSDSADLNRVNPRNQSASTLSVMNP